MASRKTFEDLKDAIRKIEEGSYEAFPAASSKDQVDSAHTHGAESCSAANVSMGAQEDDDLTKAFAKISRIVSLAEKSSRQIRERLARDGFDEETIDSALDRALSCGMVDDARYADWLVRSRLRQGRGLAGIERELAAEGYSLQDLPGWPDEYGYDVEAEVQRALEFLDAHPPHSKNLRASAYRKLVTKGFSVSYASSAARTWCEGRE